MVRVWKAETVHLLITYWVGAFFVFGILSYTSIDAREDTLKRQFNVGYQVLDLKCQKDGEEKTLTVAVEAVGIGRNCKIGYSQSVDEICEKY